MSRVQFESAQSSLCCEGRCILLQGFGVWALRCLFILAGNRFVREVEPVCVQAEGFGVLWRRGLVSISEIFLCEFGMKGM